MSELQISRRKLLKASAAGAVAASTVSANFLKHSGRKSLPKLYLKNDGKYITHSNQHLTRRNIISWTEKQPFSTTD